MTFPASFSVYRGQSTWGIGEGPGRPIRSGEQYIAADSPFAVDLQFLESVRGWLTLDAPTQAHQAAGGAAEGWAVFDTMGFMWVARLGSAGRYTETDQRAAYFTHARGWDIRKLPPGTDPAILLGRVEAFAAPPGAAEIVAPDIKEPVAFHPGQIKSHGDLAIALLAHLLVGRAIGSPVVVVVEDYRDFAPGSGVTTAVAFARAALPRHLQRDCNVRTLTQGAAALIRGSSNVAPAALLVLHQRDYDVALRAAQEARRPAIVLDRRGAHIAGAAAPAAAHAYAKLVHQEVTSGVDSAALAAFAARVSEVWPKKYSPEWWQQREAKALVISVPAIYSLATPTSGLTAALLRQAEMTPRLTWPKLLDVVGAAPALASLDNDHLLALLSAAPLEERESDGTTLRNEVFQEIDRRGIQLDDWLETSGADPVAAIALGNAGRASAKAVARMTSTIDLNRLPLPVALNALKMEADGLGTLAHRGSEVDILTRIAREHVGGPKALFSLSGRFGLTTAWVDPWGNGADDATVHAEFEEILAEYTPSAALRSRVIQITTTTGKLNDRSLTLIDTTLRSPRSPVERVQLSAILHKHGRTLPERPNMQWFADASAEQKSWAVKEACKGNLLPFGPEALIKGNTGELSDAVVWLAEGAGVVSKWLKTDKAKGYADEIRVAALIELAEQCEDDDAAIRAIVSLLDGRLCVASAQTRAQTTTQELIDKRRWAWWAKQSQAEPLSRRGAAAIWARVSRAGIQHVPPDDEDMAGLLRCFDAGIDGVTMSGLVAPLPPLPGSTRDLVLKLAKECADVGAVAWLVTTGELNVAEILGAAKRLPNGLGEWVVLCLTKDEASESEGANAIRELNQPELDALGSMFKAGNRQIAPTLTRAEEILDHHFRESLPGAEPKMLQFWNSFGWLSRPSNLVALAKQTEIRADAGNAEKWIEDLEKVLPETTRRGAGGLFLPGLALSLRERAPRVARLMDRPGPNLTAGSTPPEPLNGTEHAHCGARLLLGLATPDDSKVKKSILDYLNKPQNSGSGSGTQTAPLEAVAKVIADYMKNARTTSQAQARKAAWRFLRNVDFSANQPHWKFYTTTQRIPIVVLLAAVAGPDGLGQAAADVVRLAEATRRTDYLRIPEWWKAWARTLESIPTTLGWRAPEDGRMALAVGAVWMHAQPAGRETDQSGRIVQPSIADAFFRGIDITEVLQ